MAFLLTELRLDPASLVSSSLPPLNHELQRCALVRRDGSAHAEIHPAGNGETEIAGE